jgi:hypothetical protein
MPDAVASRKRGDWADKGVYMYEVLPRKPKK